MIHILGPVMEEVVMDTTVATLAMVVTTEGAVKS